MKISHRYLYILALLAIGVFVAVGQTFSNRGKTGSKAVAQRASDTSNASCCAKLTTEENSAARACCESQSSCCSESSNSKKPCCQAEESPVTDRESADEFMLMMQGMAGLGPKDSNWVASKLFDGFIAAPMPCCGEPGSKNSEDEHACCDRQRDSNRKAAESTEAEKALVHFESQFGGASAHAKHFTDLLKQGIAPSKKYVLPPLPQELPESIPADKLTYSEWMLEYRKAGTVPLAGEYQRYLTSTESTGGNTNARLIESQDESDGEESQADSDVIEVDVTTFPENGSPELPDEVTAKKHFQVSAINVDMVYNRFGGHDRLASMYVLDEERDRVKAGSGLFNGGHDPLFYGCGRHEHLKVRNPISGEEHPEDVLTIEPLVIRANLGDTIVLDLTNRLNESLPERACGAGSVQDLSESEFWTAKTNALLPSTDNPDGLNSKISLHIRGAAYAEESPDASLVGFPGVDGESGRVRYTIKIPESKTALGTYYFHSRPLTTASDADTEKSDEINRMVAQVTHGLFGALIIEPAGSRYFDNEQFEIEDDDPIDYTVAEGSYKEVKSGWGAIIVPGDGSQPFREYALFFHDNLLDKITGLVERDPRAINYRTEPFADIFSPGVEGTRPRTLGSQPFAVNDRSMAYSAYTYGDSSTPHPRFYVGDRMCYRVIHSGMGDQFHVFHHHAHRWRFQPRVTEKGSPSGLPNETSQSKYGVGLPNDIGKDQPDVALSTSTRIDSQTLGPAETFDVFMEGGAGGVQRTVGDVLLHCHIINHVTQGMWTYCRIHNTLQTPTDRKKRLPELLGSDADGDDIDDAMDVNETGGIDANMNGIDDRFDVVIAPTIPGLAPMPDRVPNRDAPLSLDPSLKPPMPVKYDDFVSGIGKLKSAARKKFRPVSGVLSRLVNDSDPLVSNEVDLFNLHLESQLPLRGTPQRDEKADPKDPRAINRADSWPWDRDIDENGRPEQYFGEPYDIAGHGVVHFGSGFPTAGEGIGARPIDLVDKDGDPPSRPTLLFNPVDGRLSYPHLLPYAGNRPPFAPKKRLVVEAERSGTTFTRVKDEDADGKITSASVVADALAQGAPFLGSSVGGEGMANPTSPVLGHPTGSGLVPLEKDRVHSNGIIIKETPIVADPSPANLKDYLVNYSGNFSLPSATGDIRSTITLSVASGQAITLVADGADVLQRHDGGNNTDIEEGNWKISLVEEGVWDLIEVTNGRSTITPPATVRHYDIVALTLPIDYTKHNGHPIAKSFFGTTALPEPPSETWDVEIKGEGVAWAGQYIDRDSFDPVGPELQSIIHVRPGQKVYWTIPSAGQQHGVVLLDSAVARRIFSSIDPLIPQPRFAGDGNDPVGVEPVLGKREVGDPILELTIRDDLAPEEFEPVDFICNVHGVVMKGALVFEPQDPFVDENGQIFVLRDDVPDVVAGRKPAEPIVIRANAGDVIDVTLTSALVDNKQNRGYSKVGIHTHLVQYDVQGSDGAVAGLNYETSIRPSLKWNQDSNTLESIGAAVRYGEQVHYRWWCDVDLGTIYFHDHSLLKDSLPHGLFGATVVEPFGSEYRDPETGEELYVRSLGRITSSSTRNGLTVADIESKQEEKVKSFREFVPLFNDVQDSINLRKEPLPTFRMGNPFGQLSLLDPSKFLQNEKRNNVAWGYSSEIHGDPVTNIWRAYPDDPFKIRTEGGGTHEIHSLRVHGHGFPYERNYKGNSNRRDFGVIGVSEAFTFDAQAGQPGDYLYGGTGELDLIDNGKWGLLRVLEKDTESKKGRVGDANYLAVVVDRPATITIPKNHLFTASNGEHFVTTKRTFVRMSRGTEAPKAYSDLVEFHKFKLSQIIDNRSSSPNFQDQDVWVFGVEVQPLHPSDRTNLPANTAFATQLDGTVVLPEEPEQIAIGQTDLTEESYVSICRRILMDETGPGKHLRQTFVQQDPSLLEIVRRLSGLDQSNLPISNPDCKLDDRCRFIATFLNETLLSSTDLYSKNSFREIPLPHLLSRLIGSRNSLQPDELQLMNRLLLEVAFPGSISPVLRSPRIVGIRSLNAFEGGKTPLRSLRSSNDLSVPDRDDPNQFYVVATDVIFPIKAENAPVSGDVVDGVTAWRQGNRMSRNNGTSTDDRSKALVVYGSKDDEIVFDSIRNSHEISIRRESASLVANTNDAGTQIPDAPIRLLPEAKFKFANGKWDRIPRGPGEETTDLGTVKIENDLNRPFFVTCGVHEEQMQVVILSRMRFLTYLRVNEAQFAELQQIVEETDNSPHQRYEDAKKKLEGFIDDFRNTPDPLVLRTIQKPGKSTSVSVKFLNLLPSLTTIAADELNAREQLNILQDELGTKDWSEYSSLNLSNSSTNANNDGSAVGRNQASIAKSLGIQDYSWTIPPGVSSCMITDRADPRHQLLGLYGGLIIEPGNYTTATQTVADIKATDETPAFKEFVLFLQDNWLLNEFGINYGNANNPPDVIFETPDLESESGENVVVRVFQGAGKGGFANHAFFVGERRWPFDFHLDDASRKNSNHISAITTVPNAAFDLWLGKNPTVKKKAVSFYGSGVGNHLSGGEWGKFIVTPK